MSNKLFQGVLAQMHEAIHRMIGVVDESATIVACSDPSRTGLANEFIALDLTDQSGAFVRDGFTYHPFASDIQNRFAIFVEGSDELAAKYAHILSVSLATIKQFHDENYNRNNFVKNVVLDNILPGDIFIKARDLRFNMDVSRVAFLIRALSVNDISIYDVVQNLFPDKQKDFVFNVNETDLVLVKEVSAEIEQKDLINLARSIVDTLSSEFFTHSVIGIGSIVTGVKELARSFKESQLALEVSKVFEQKQTVVSYANLGIARLIYQLPTTMCETFLKEVFKQGSIESLDHETLFTIQRFFENSLNVSETSRKLFVHRNTLVYRLEKIKKLTGLDLREFDHAIVFKIALMVKKYLVSDTMKL